MKLQEVFHLPQKHVELLTERDKQHSQGQSVFDKNKINWDDISNAIASIQKRDENKMT